MYNEENEVINHHGFERRVLDAKSDVKTEESKIILNGVSTILMSKVVPILAVLFTIIYWAYAIYCYYA